MAFSQDTTDCLLGIYLTLGDYPILRNRIRSRMREVMAKRVIINLQDFEAEVRDRSIRSQQLEGIEPYEEPPDVWGLRMARVRNQWTDLTFSQHLTFDDFEQILQETLNERGISERELKLSINPELAPQELVFEQAMTIEHLSSEERFQYEPRLQESKVVLIRTLISDQLRYINIAKEWFTISDLANIKRRKIGGGRIGGKAAGMLLAVRILRELTDKPVKESIRYPESFFVGSYEFYSFMSINNLIHWNDQKYKNEAQMRAEYPQIVEDFLKGEFPPDILEKFQSLIGSVGSKPLIVRSSSLLEDNFGMAFAGKYESHFLPNQGTPKQNLKELTQAISRVYASTLNPTALLYRRRRGLQDYDEQMAILIQVVEGEKFGRYFLPHGAGVAFSRNQYRWSPLIRGEDGFLRLVWGLGTRAVDRVGNDYPHLIALSHPLLRPSSDPKNLRRYSQHYVDLIDLEDNSLKTLPVSDVLNSNYPTLRYLAQIEEDDNYSSIHSNIIGDPKHLVLTFDGLLRRSLLADRMRTILQLLEKNYHSPVDIEFTMQISELDADHPRICLTILQCRPQSHLLETDRVEIPADLVEERIIFSTKFVVPRGRIDSVDYVLFVPPEAYFALNELNDRAILARTIGNLNNALSNESFICVGPGRWGSSNSDLGVPIDYTDIYNTRALVEMAGKGISPEPEPSLGTHFFQDLLESQIYPLAVILDDPVNKFNRRFFYDTPNRIRDWIQVDDKMFDCLRLIRVIDYFDSHHIRVVMDDMKSFAIAYLEIEEQGP
jgi:hypothetical protein